MMQDTARAVADTAKTAAAATSQLMGAAEPSNTLFIVTVLLLFIIVAGMLSYLFVLQWQMFKTVKATGDLSNLPLGLPEGSVRSVLALIIVTISLYFVVLNTFRGVDIPEALTAILGTVLGFYFGSRASTKDADQKTNQALQELKNEREQAVADNLAGKSKVAVEKARKAVETAKLLAKLLPENLRKPIEENVDRAEKALAQVDNLIKIGDATGAFKKVEEVTEFLKTHNPLKGIIDKAKQTLGSLGIPVPAVAIIGSVLAIGAKLGAAAYQRWKARILHLPISPAAVPLAVADANTAFTLFLKSPIFKAAFNKKLQENDRAFMKKAMADFLKIEDADDLWTQYENDGVFESREQFNQGLAEYRRAGFDIDLVNDINQLNAEQVAKAGGYDNLVSAIDRIHENDAALADLDTLVAVAEDQKLSDDQINELLKVKETTEAGE